MSRRLSLRDRFFTPRVARAVTSPSAILATGVAAAAGVLAFGPLGVLAGAVGYAARVALAIPRNPKGTDIDPFAVQDPWRRFVSEALATQRRFESAIRGMPTGPLRDRLHEIGDRVADGVEQSWQIARRGQLIMEGRQRLDLRATRSDLADVELQLGREERVDSTRATRLAQTADALRAQLETAGRLDVTLDETVDRLRLLDARLEESVTRAIELSVAGSSVSDLSGLGSDIDDLVTEMEALRLGLEEANRPGSTGSTGEAPGTPGVA